METRRTISEIVTDVLIKVVLLLLTLATLYPFIYVVSMSVSASIYVVQQSVWLLPKGFTLESYKLVFQNSVIWQSYYNTVWYTVVGTAINVFMTVIVAFPLSRKAFFLRNPLTLFIAFTMFFSGGMIPVFMVVNHLGLYDTRWAMILPGAVNAWNIIIARTYFESIPESLDESARMDGANDIMILFRIMLPLSLPILAVLTLFYAVGHWNSFFNALIYLPSVELQTLQIYLRKILILLSQELAGSADTGLDRSVAVEQLKYAAIIVTILPILFAYPFLQKYFVKGLMIGSIKG